MGTDREPISLRQAAMLCAQEFSLTFDEDGHEETVWVRTLSGTELREAEIARHAARKAVREQYVEGTLSYEEIVDTLEGYTVNQLAAIVVSTEMPVFGERARRDLPQLMEPDWSKHITDASREKAQLEYTAREEEHGRAVYAKAIEYAQKREAQLVESTPIQELRDLVRAVSIRSSIDAQTQGFEDDYRIYNGFYEADRTTRLFDSIEDVASLNATVKQYLMAFIRQVDIVLPIDIKNLPSRSDQPTEPAENIQEPTAARSTRGSQAASSRKKSSRGGDKT
jgi:hypothetical protein